MNKNELLQLLSVNTGIELTEIEKLYTTFLEILINSLQKDEKIKIFGLGSFEMKEVPEKVKINTETGIEETIPSHKKPTFKFSKSIREIVEK